MTVGELIEKVNCDAGMKAMARSTLRAFAPQLLAAPISFTLDRSTDRITLAVGTQVILDTTLKELESYVQTPATD